MIWSESREKWAEELWFLSSRSISKILVFSSGDLEQTFMFN